jgi:hypothetical protein
LGRATEARVGEEDARYQRSAWRRIDLGLVWNPFISACFFHEMKQKLESGSWLPFKDSSAQAISIASATSFWLLIGLSPHSSSSSELNSVANAPKISQVLAVHMKNDEERLRTCKPWSNVVCAKTSLWGKDSQGPDEPEELQQRALGAFKRNTAASNRSNLPRALMSHIWQSASLQNICVHWLTHPASNRGRHEPTQQRTQ